MLGRPICVARSKLKIVNLKKISTFRKSTLRILPLTQRFDRKGSEYNLILLGLHHSNRNHILILSTSKNQQWFKDCPMAWAVDGLLDYQMERQKDHFRCPVRLEAVRLAMERVRDSIYHSQNHQWTSDHNHLRNGFENSVKCHSETSSGVAKWLWQG